MSVFPEWEQYAVHQRREMTGCIPTGYEMLLRAAGVEGIAFDTFQDEFDLEGGPLRDRTERNNFTSVADAVRRKYPHVVFKCEVFQHGGGKKKIERIEELIQQHKPVLVSIALTPRGGWHIMPVVDAEDDELIMLEGMLADGKKCTKGIRKDELVRIHEEYPGGNDIAYLDK